MFNAGKGDKNRTTDQAAYNANLAEVQFSGVPANQDPAFKTNGAKSVKRYGAPAHETFEKLSGKIVIH